MEMWKVKTKKGMVERKQKKRKQNKITTEEWNIKCGWIMGQIKVDQKRINMTRCEEAGQREKASERTWKIRAFTKKHYWRFQDLRHVRHVCASEPLCRYIWGFYQLLYFFSLTSKRFVIPHVLFVYGIRTHSLAHSPFYTSSSSASSSSIRHFISTVVPFVANVYVCNPLRNKR